MSASLEAAQLVAKVVIDDAGAKAELDTMQNKAKQAQSGISGLLGKLGSFATGALAFAGINAGLSGLAQGIGAIFSMDEGLENTTTAFTKLLGSASAAKNEIASLQKFSADTPLQLPDVEQATQKLLGYQFQLSQTQPILTAVGDALSATGNLNSATLQQVITVFGQMHASISLHTQDLMQLSSAGINAFQVLADSMKPTKTQIDALVKQGLIPAGDAAGYLSGKTKLTAGDIQQLVTDGLIPSKQGIDALTKGIEANPIYKGGMATQAQTTAGRISTLKDNIGLALQKMSMPIFNDFSKIIGKIGDAVSSPAFQNFATTVGTDIGGAITNTTKAVENVVGWFQKWHEPILAVASAIALFLLPATLAEIGGLIAMAVEGIAGAIAAIPGLIAGFVGWAIAGWSAAAATIAATWPVLAIIAAIALLVVGIVLLVTHWKQVTDFLGTVWQAVVTGVQVGLTWLGNAFSGLGTLVGKVGKGLGNAIKTGINDVIGIINGFIRFIDSIQIHIPAVGVGPAKTPAFDWNGLNIPQIPKLASGGLITQGGLAVVGDVPEFVSMPQTRYLPAGAQVTPLGKAGNTYNFNITNGQVDEQRLAVIMRQHEMLAGVA